MDSYNYCFYGNPSSCESSSSGGATTTYNNNEDEGEVEVEERKEGSGVDGVKRSGVKLSTDPQSVAARQRRHRISDRFKILQSLVPGGSKMDTVSMLEEAIHYVKFLKAQIWLHQTTMFGFSDHHEFISLFSPPPPPPPPHHIFITDDDNLCSQSNLLSTTAPIPPRYSCFHGGEIKTLPFDPPPMNY